jgi:hypothetical protein
MAISQWRTYLTAFACLILVGCEGFRVKFEDEQFYRWHELSPPPTDKTIERFRAKFPTTPVTTTQPNTWNKIEVGMTRGMVRALAGERLSDPERSNVAILRQDPPHYTKWSVRLYFRESYGDDTPSIEDDVLEAIIIRRKVDRPMGSTDWP